VQGTAVATEGAVLVHTPGITYRELRTGFRWELPARFNIGTACADDQVASTLALVEIAPSGQTREHTFGEVAELSNRFAHGLASLGVTAGDRVGIVLPQGLETGVAHLAVYKLGGIAVPLSGLFGPDALRYRLGDSGARAVITDSRGLERVAEVAADLAGPEVIVAGEQVARPHRSFHDLVRGGAASFPAADTTPDTPALLIYTSGTTGPPKGALHGHRVLHGHLPGYELMYDFFPQTGDRMWTPADWAWIGGLLDALLPSWFHGVPIVAAARGGFDPEWAVRLMADHRVRNAFIPPTALKLMRQAGVRHGSGLRSVMSGGEPLGEEMLAWARDHLGVVVNEIFGQTEANLVVGNSHGVWDVRPGSMGRPYPGHDVVVLAADGRPAPPGAVGDIAVRAPDPVMFLEYWNRPDATRDKFRGEWLVTGDLGRVDEDGYLWFSSRADDVINSAGYRIGPAEIEECLLGHRAVAMAAAVGVPDEVRGQVVKAFIKLAEGHQPSPQLEGEIAALVRSRLAAYEYPRRFEFVEELPLTTTGKIRRNELRRLEEERRSGHAS
jgi:acetyl-CoA synthetase